MRGLVRGANRMPAVSQRMHPSAPCRLRAAGDARSLDGRRRRHRIGWHRGGLSVAMFIVAPRCFEGSRGFRKPDTLGRSDLGAAMKKECHVWLRTLGSFVKGRCVHRSDRHSRPAARSRLNDRGIGHPSRGRGQSIGWSIARSKHGAVRPSCSSRPFRSPPFAPSSTLWLVSQLYPGSGRRE